MPQSYIIRNATIISPGHSNHLKQSDLQIVDGKIAALGKNLTGDVVIEGSDLCVSVGWMDLRSHLNDPGKEYKDTVQSLLNTAEKGGFTAVCTLPNATPPINSKSAVEYLKKQAANHLVDLFPTGKLSEEENSENLAEVYDMHQSGAVAFTDGDTNLSNGVLKKALLYNKPFGSPVLSQPMDASLHKKGMVNESENTIHTGLKASPAVAEYIAVLQQLEIADYCDATLHFSAITSAKSVELIRKAKAAGQKVTCDTTIFHLCFTDRDVLSFDENFKVYPPLRGEGDRKALIEGLKDGTIDAICSNHQPHEVEAKRVEFDYADFGALSLQLVWPWYVKYLQKDIDMEVFADKLSVGPRQVLGIKLPRLAEGETANLTVFSKSEKWTFNNASNASLSRNSHEWEKEMVGKVKAVFNKNQVNIF